MADPSSLTTRIGAAVTGHSRSQAAFGPLVERDGVTVIPVARVHFGFGGGEGGEGRSAGGGGGGGGHVEPVGYLRITDARVTWHPLLTPRNVASSLFRVAVGLGLAAFLAMRGAALLEQARAARSHGAWRLLSA